MKREIIIYAIFIIIFNIFLIKAETINDIRRKVQEQIRKLNSRDNLYNLLDKGGIFNCENIYCTQISLLNSQYIDEQSQKFPQIYPLNIGDNYVVVKIFTKHIFPEESKNYLAGINAISDIVYFNLYNYEYDIINSDPVDFLTFGQKEIFVYLPLYVDNSLKNKILSVLGQSESSGIENLIDYDIFNPNAKIYNDICTTITYSILPEDIYNQESIKNLDITLEQRKKYYFPGNLQLCPKNCIYKGIDRKTISSICQCNIEYLNIVEHNEYISFNFNENNFYNNDEDIYFSMNTMKCLSSVNLKNNYGFFIIFIIAIVILSCFCLIFLFGKKYLKEILNLPINNNNYEKNNTDMKIIKNVTNKNNPPKKNSESNKEIKSDIELNDVLNLHSHKNVIHKIEENSNNKNKNNEGSENNENNIIINTVTNNDKNMNEDNNKNNDNKSNNNSNDNKEKILDNNNTEKSSDRNQMNNTEEKEKDEIIKNDSIFTIQEINSMNYKQSSKYDKRNFTEIYYSFLNMKQPIFFLLNYYPINEDKIIRVKFNTLKIIIFCYEVMIYLLIYSSFFGSKTISKIYFGDFNFGKKCVLGIIIAPFAMILKSLVYFFTFGLMNKKITNIKITNIEIESKIEERNDEKDTKENDKLKKLIDEAIDFFKKQLYILLGVSIIILLFDWLLVSSFCSVYNNSQVEFFISILACYLFSNIFSFIYCLVPTTFRYYALKNDSETLFNLYVISKII